MNYSKDKMMELENRIAILEGKDPPHKKICTYCDDKGSIYCWSGHQDWYEDCPKCKGE